MRRLTLALGGLLAAAATTGDPPAATAQETGSVYVCPAFPPVDVAVDGAHALDDFAPGKAQARSTCRRARARLPSSRPTPPTARARRCSRPPRRCPPGASRSWRTWTRASRP